MRWLLIKSCVFESVFYAGIGGLEKFVLNSATLCNTPACPPFNALLADTSPILRVAVDPKNLSKLNLKLIVTYIVVISMLCR